MIFITLILLASSIAIIARNDPNKLWDHLARSLVQIGIAIATVSVAITLFEKQISERDLQSASQQKLLAASFLQAHIRQLIARSKFPVGMAFEYWDCPEKSECTPREADEESIKLKLDRAIESPDTLLYSKEIDKKDLWQLVRASPLLPDQFFDHLLENLDDFELDDDLAEAFISVVLQEYSAERSKSSEGVSSDAINKYVAQLVKLQAREARAVSQLICYLSDRVSELRKGTSSDLRFDVTPEIPLCPPHTDGFRTLFEATAKHRQKFGEAQEIKLP
ncbi:hypothetical protein ACQR16_22810 [Bradyrhizobium oligotrophicum]|uniref:hypothetical protein n=3 Tax=Bradyrhizobium oligotrophicum TaxID=44255 RepID=UPI003EBF0A60